LRKLGKITPVLIKENDNLFIDSFRFHTCNLSNTINNSINYEELQNIMGFKSSF